MLSAFASAEGCYWEETLTGFKWLGNRALDLEGGAAAGERKTVRGNL